MKHYEYPSQKSAGYVIQEKYVMFILWITWKPSSALWARCIEFFFLIEACYHVRRVPCHHGMARPQVADGGEALQVWGIAAHIFNKQSRTAGLVLGVGLTTPSRKK
jgi:hypothetical protein